MAKRIIWALIILGALVFAVHGGEYSTYDLWRQRERKARLQAETDSLQREVDSLRGVARAIATDPATQERIAREEFGMVRGDKEILYRLTDPTDSSASR
ncbi:MAG TPA: septum formation initiator family protein [Gemmatimonadaceae bacterium]